MMLEVWIWQGNFVARRSQRVSGLFHEQRARHGVKSRIVVTSSLDTFAMLGSATD
jgi:hypothetical protein